jgi:hypothetical protein
MVAPARARAVTYKPMAPLAQALSAPAQGAQAAAYGGPSLGQIDSRRALAMQLIGNATQGPTGGGLGALAKALTAGVGAYAYRKADDQETVANQAMNDIFAKGGDIDVAAIGRIDPKTALQYQLQRSLKDPQETWQPGTISGREGMVSSTGQFDPFPEMKGQEPYSAVAKAQADLQAGRITPEQFQAIYENETYIAPRDPKTTWGDVMEIPGIGPVQVSSTGQINPLRQNLPDEPYSDPYAMPGVEGLVQKGPKGEIKQVPGSAPDAGDMKQIDAAGFATRMEQAEATLTQMEDAGYSPSMTRNAATEYLPESARNLVLSNDQIAYDAAKRRV